MSTISQVLKGYPLGFTMPTYQLDKGAPKAIATPTHIIFRNAAGEDVLPYQLNYTFLNALKEGKFSGLERVKDKYGDYCIYLDLIQKEDGSYYLTNGKDEAEVLSWDKKNTSLALAHCFTLLEGLANLDTLVEMGSLWVPSPSPMYPMAFIAGIHLGNGSRLPLQPPCLLVGEDAWLGNLRIHASLLVEVIERLLSLPKTMSFERAILEPFFEEDEEEIVLRCHSCFGPIASPETDSLFVGFYICRIVRKEEE